MISENKGTNESMIEEWKAGEQFNKSICTHVVVVVVMIYNHIKLQSTQQNKQITSCYCLPGQTVELLSLLAYTIVGSLAVILTRAYLINTDDSVPKNSTTITLNVMYLDSTYK